jgi:hypothetical protein
LPVAFPVGVEVEGAFAALVGGLVSLQAPVAVPAALLLLPPAGVDPALVLPAGLFFELLHPLITVAAVSPIATKTNARLRISGHALHDWGWRPLNVVGPNISRMCGRSPSNETNS